MFEGDSADMCAGKFPLMMMGGRVEDLACVDPEARTPIGGVEILSFFLAPVVKIPCCQNEIRLVLIQK